METRDTSAHPCFNSGTANGCGRLHLPVAPGCTITCNYCDRRFDCPNETRPGVASSVLTPRRALDYAHRVLDLEPRIRVAGIAGPGDPFAQPERTLETLELLRQELPQLLVCLASNGLGVPDYLDRLARLGLTHMTLTVNSVDPAIGARIHTRVRDGERTLTGEAGAGILLERQMRAIEGLKARGIAVKVNTIVIPGVNAEHVREVAQTVSRLGADLHNLVPLWPTEGTPFVHLSEPDPGEMEARRRECEGWMAQMRHCRRCRADAAGLLAEDRSGEFAGVLRACAGTDPASGDRPYVAVATREGRLINLHLGQAGSLQIWGTSGGSPALVEERNVPARGRGDRWHRLARTLSDCRAVLAGGAGDVPQRELEERGTTVHVVSGLIEDGLHKVYEAGDVGRLKPRTGGVAAGCSSGGGGEGCC